MQDIKKVTNDPMYKEFLDFKELVMNKLSIAMKQEQNERDGFMYTQRQQDIYFGGAGDEPSWNSPKFSPQLASAQALNPNNRMPAFFI